MKRALKRCIYDPSFPACLRLPVYIYLPYDVCLSGQLIKWHDGQFRLTVHNGETSVTFRHSDVIGVNVGTGRSFWLRGSVVLTQWPNIKEVSPRRKGLAEKLLDILRL